MIYRRERPICRKTLLFLCQKYDCTLQQLLDHSHICLSKNLRTQAKKMISEGKFRSAKEKKDFEEKVGVYRAVGLIK